MVNRPTLGLAMMVSNEEAIVERALLSVRDHIDWWTVTDTGSTDRTEEIVRETLKDVPGQFLHVPWVDFGHNRTVALDANRGHCDYSFMLDADDEAVFDKNWRIPSTEPASYYVQVEAGVYRYTRTHLFRTDLPWKYHGRIHEYSTLDRDSCGDSEFMMPQRLEGVRYIQRFCEGFHSGNPDKFVNDAAIMNEEWLQTGDPRWLFMLAQSYKDAGMPREAAETYELRARYVGDGWEQERYVSLLELGKLREDPDALTIAYAFDPTRIEALVWLARVYRLRGMTAVADLFVEKGLQLARRHDLPDALYIELDCWHWRIYDEAALIKSILGDAQKAEYYGMAARDNATPDLADEDERARLEHNVAQYSNTLNEMNKSEQDG